MPFANVDGLTAYLSTRGHSDKPEDMLGYHENCVAMALSKCLGVGVYPAINFFIHKGWIQRASDLENDSAYARVLEGLGMGLAYDYQDWSSVKLGIRGGPDGRWFCVNLQHNRRGGDGHAFAIVKKGGTGVVGNNQETTDRSYHAAIMDGHKINAWGPLRSA
jgi:hypothetical protein